MKKITLILLVIAGSVNAQVVNIPDFDFKDALINSNCVDTNGDGVYDSDADLNDDGEIQLSEAENIIRLNVAFDDIQSISGIENFTNLEVLDCSNNFFNTINLAPLVALKNLDIHGNLLTALDVNSNVNLETLDCSQNEIPSLNLTLNISLQNLDCSSNDISTIDLSMHPSITTLICDNMFTLNTLNVSQCPNLNSVNCEFSSILNLNASSNPNLEFLYCYENGISTINIDQTPLLKVLDCYNNNIGNLDVSTSPLLEDLDCRFNNISVLDISQNIQLDRLWVNSNNLVTIDVTQNLLLTDFSLSSNGLISDIDLTQNINLLNFSCSNTQLLSLDVTQNIVLEDLRITFNQLTALDLSQNPNLEYLYANNNQITTLDLTENPNFLQIRVDDNDLTSLFLKNGNQETSSLTFEGNDDLEYICSDESDLFIVDLRLNDYGYTDTVLNTFCSFEPGGDFNTITGSIIFDDNDDGCDPSDIPQPHIKIDMNDGFGQESTFTGSNGNYFFYTLDGSFDISPTLEQPSWFNVSPISATIPFTNTNNNVVNQDFCISANGIHNDLEIAIAPIAPARPGFDAVYQIVYNNKGNQTLSGDFELDYNESVLDFVSATEVPDIQNSGNIVWNYTDLLPFENRTVYVTLNVNSPSETPPVNIEDELVFVATINPIAGDEFVNDNTFEYEQIVVGAFDPNDISCLQGDFLPTTEIGNFLHYVINFENIGTFEAENVVIEIDIDPAQYDINTLRVLNASHMVDARVKDDKVKFIFENINLAASGGHGNILIRIQTNTNLQLGQFVTQQANIHFDYNFPIETNDAITVFENLSVNDYEIDTSVKIFPNPVNDVLNISANRIIKTIEIFDVQGRIIQTALVNETSVSLNTDTFTNGIYFFRIKTEVGAHVQKIIKD